MPFDKLRAVSEVEPRRSNLECDIVKLKKSNTRLLDKVRQVSLLWMRRRLGKAQAPGSGLQKIVYTVT
jgi:hypothetical protein